MGYSFDIWRVKVGSLTQAPGILAFWHCAEDLAHGKSP